MGADQAEGGPQQFAQGAAPPGSRAGFARAHARSGDRIAISSYLGSGDVIDRASAEFSEAYAEQNERDYDALRQAVKEGRVEAQTGV